MLGLNLKLLFHTSLKRFEKTWHDLAVQDNVSFWAESTEKKSIINFALPNLHNPDQLAVKSEASQTEHEGVSKCFSVLKPYI